MITTTHGNTVQPRAPAASAPLSGEALVEETRREIQRLAQEMRQLAQSRVAPAAFREQFLVRLASATGGHAAAWWESHEGKWRLVTGHQLAETGLLQSSGEQAACARALASIPADRFPLYMSPSSTSPSGTENAEQPSSLLAAYSLDAARRTIVQIHRRPVDNVAAQRGYLQFLAQMMTLAHDYFQRQPANDRSSGEFWPAFERVLRDLHGRAGLEARASRLVESARRLLGCDRVSIAWRGGTQLGILAISGAARIDARSEDVQRLKRAARCAAEYGKPVDSSVTSAKLPDTCQAALDDLCQRSSTKAVAILPLYANAEMAGDVAGPAGSAPWDGALICEITQCEQFAAQFTAHAAVLAAHGGLALASAVPRRKSGSMRRGAWRLSLAIVLLAAVGTALALVPAPLRIGVTGKLLPAERFDIFAHDDGTIIKVHAEHAQMVEKGEVLAEMQSTELAVQISEVMGQRDKTIEQLHAREQLLVQSQDLNAIMQQQLAGEVTELKQTLRNLQQRLELFRQKQARLKVRSPIRGQVVTWNVHDTLLRRPVRTGQVLMSVVNPDGPWELELYVPERRLGHLLDTLHRSEEPVEVRFQLHSQSGQEFIGTIIDYHRLAEMRGEEGNTVAVRVAVDKDAIPQLHNETSVSAQIQCGTRSLGGVLFQDVIETAQRTWLYWF